MEFGILQTRFFNHLHLMGSNRRTGPSGVAQSTSQTLSGTEDPGSNQARVQGFKGKHGKFLIGLICIICVLEGLNKDIGQKYFCFKPTFWNGTKFYTW
jgi:hypothetical protein